MSHDVEQMVSGEGRIPWHYALGTNTNLTDGLIGRDDALRLGGLDWHTFTEPVYVKRDALYVPVEDRVAIVRDSDRSVLGIGGSDYECVANDEAIDVALAVQDTGEAQITTAGSLRGGRVGFATLALEREVQTDGDRIMPFLTVAWSHDLSMALRLFTGDVRVVCANTLSAGLRRAHRTFSVKHTRNARQRLDEARDALDVAVKTFDAFEAEYRTLVAKKVTDQRFDAIVTGLFPDTDAKSAQTKRQHARDELWRLWDESDTIGAFRGTGWGVVNAANEYELWIKPIKGGAQRRSERQAMNFLRGTPLTLTAKARELALT